jgi:quinol monooxygenase YgiN
MILALLELIPQPAKRQEVVDILLLVKWQIHLKPGFLGCDITTGIQDEKLLYLEKWESNNELFRHLRSKEYLMILGAMELACEPPKISFFDVLNERRMELIEQIRNDTIV